MSDVTGAAGAAGAADAAGGPSSLPEALTGLIGEWSGDGVGSSPSAEAGFRFVAQLSVTLAGPNLLAWRSVSLPQPADSPLDLSDTDRPTAVSASDTSPESDGSDTETAEAGLAMTESGFWRWNGATGQVEVVLARAAGGVVVLQGDLRPDPQGGGAHVELASEVIAHTATGEPSSGERRLYARRGDVLLFAVDRKQRDGDLMPRASGALHPQN